MMFVLPIHFGIFLKNAEESKKPAFCTDSSIGGPFFSSHPVDRLQNFMGAICISNFENYGSHGTHANRTL